MASIRIIFAKQARGVVRPGPVLTGAGRGELAVAKAIGQTGEAFIKVAQRQGAIARHKKSLQVKENSNSIFQEAIKNSQADENDTTIKVDSPDAFKLESNKKTFTDWVLSEYDARTKETLKGFEGNLGFQGLQRDIAEERVRIKGSAQNYEARQTRQLSLEMIGDSAMAVSRLVRKDPTAFSRLNAEFLQTVEDSKLSGIDVKKQGNRFSRMFALESAEGTIERDPQEAKRIFESGKLTFQEFPGGPVRTVDVPFMKHLSGDQIESLSKKADIRISQDLAVQKTNVSQKMKSHFESLIDTGEGMPGLSEEVKVAFSDEPHKIERFLREERTAKSFHVIGQTIKGSSISEMSALVKGLTPKPGAVDFSDQKDLFEKATQEVDKQIKMSRTDPAQLMFDNFKEHFEKLREDGLVASELTQVNMSFQKEKGVPSSQIRALTNTERQAFVSAIQKSSGGQDTLDILTQISGEFDMTPEDGTSPLSSKVLNEISGASGLSPLYRVVVSNISDRTDPNGRSTAFDVSRAIKFSEDVEKALPKEVRAEIKSSVDSETSDWFQAFVANKPENLSRGNELRQAIAQTAGMYVHKDGMTAEDATERAVQNLLDNKLAPGGITFSNVTNGVIVPRVIMDEDRQVLMNAENVEDQLDWMKERLLEVKFGEDVLDRLDKAFIHGRRTGNVDLVDRLVDEMDLGKTVRIGSDPSTAEDITRFEAGVQNIMKNVFSMEFIGNMQREALKNLTYQTSQDGESVTLMIQFLHQKLPVLDKEGRPLEFRMTEINGPLEGQDVPIEGP